MQDQFMDAHKVMHTQMCMCTHTHADTHTHTHTQGHTYVITFKTVSMTLIEGSKVKEMHTKAVYRVYILAVLNR
jgi:hypothetical protein